MPRLDKVLANLGYATRSSARALVASGRVSVDGVPAVQVAMAVRDPAAVTIDGEPLDHPHGILVAVHKPVGYVCSHDAGEGLRVYDLLPERWLERNPAVMSVGRLDKDTSGLILVTDDMVLVHRLTSPKRHVEKAYVATLTEAPPHPDDIVAEFASGELLLDADDRPCLPAALRWIDPETAEVVLTEGRYHQVRRMFAACGLHVAALHRARFGPYAVTDVAPGEWIDVAPPT